MIKHNVIMIERFTAGYGLSYYNPKTGKSCCHIVKYHNNGLSEKDNFDATYNEATIMRSCYLDCGMESVRLTIALNVIKSVVEFPEFESFMSENEFINEKSSIL